MKFVALVCALAVTAAQAADFKETARGVAEKSGPSAIMVRIVSALKMEFQGQNMNQEQKSEVAATIIDPSGLTVSSASALEPATLMKRMLRGMKLDTTIKETTFILADGTEVPAEIVMKDTDLDMAFLMPKEAGKTFPAVELKAATAQPKVLDDVFLVGRMGKEGNRAVHVDTGMIRSIVKGPRTYYVCSAEVSQHAGRIVSTPDGSPLGLVVTKMAPGGDGDEGGDEMGLGMLFSMGAKDNMPLPIVRPVDDLIEAAKQAKDAKAKKK
ncbi:MAG TPA: serine protease [Planctomycetota bacterium]|jgi:hypothetical protein